VTTRAEAGQLLGGPSRRNRPLAPPDERQRQRGRDEAPFRSHDTPPRRRQTRVGAGSTWSSRGRAGPGSAVVGVPATGSPDDPREPAAGRHVGGGASTAAPARPPALATAAVGPSIPPNPGHATGTTRRARRVEPWSGHSGLPRHLTNPPGATLDPALVRSLVRDRILDAGSPSSTVAAARNALARGTSEVAFEGFAGDVRERGVVLSGAASSLCRSSAGTATRSWGERWPGPPSSCLRSGRSADLYSSGGSDKALRSMPSSRLGGGSPCLAR
jgi:hypothetical protein